MGELSKLPNIGAFVEKQLDDVGIKTYEQLKKAGSKEAWLKIKAIDPSACIHRLYALEGAIEGIKKSNLSPEIKKELKEFYIAETNYLLEEIDGEYKNEEYIGLTYGPMTGFYVININLIKEWKEGNL